MTVTVDGRDDALSVESVDVVDDHQWGSLFLRRERGNRTPLRAKIRAFS